MSRLLALIPLAWGDEALEGALAAAQKVVGKGEFAVVLLGVEPTEGATERAARAGARQVYHALHAGMAGCEEPAGWVAMASQALAELGTVAERRRASR